MRLNNFDKVDSFQTKLFFFSILDKRQIDNLAKKYKLFYNFLQ